MFRELISLDEAKQRIEEYLHPKPVGTIDVQLTEASSRVLARDLISPLDVPPFNRSTVDGFAVKAENTFSADENKPVTLKVIGRVNVGEVTKLQVKKGNSMEIVTGAPLPDGADSVVMVENTSQVDGEISIYRSVVKGENVMVLGSDIRKGDTILKMGTILSPRELGVLAALGFNNVEVFRKPVVAIISTGGEIVEPGRSLPPGKIYDINTFTLTAAVKESGGEVMNFGVVSDDNIDLLKVELKKALEAADVIITSGGVSVGPKDYVPRVIDELGKPGLVVHGVAIKPGKPFAFGVVDGKPIFSLPGHPTSSLLAFMSLVQPVLYKLGCRDEEPSKTLKAIASNKFFSSRGRRTFITVTLKKEDADHWVATQASAGHSGAITTLAFADGYIEVKEDQPFIDAGEEVDVYLF